MLADIIRHSRRGKMTLQELYDYLQTHYPNHFPNSGGWRVQPPKYLTDVGRTPCDMRCQCASGSRNNYERVLTLTWTKLNPINKTLRPSTMTMRVWRYPPIVLTGQFLLQEVTDR